MTALQPPCLRCGSIYPALRAAIKEQERRHRRGEATSTVDIDHYKALIAQCRANGHADHERISTSIGEARRAR